MTPLERATALACADQHIADFSKRLGELVGEYREMVAEGKDRNEAVCYLVVGIGIGIETDPLSVVSILAVAIAELAERPDRTVV